MGVLTINICLFFGVETVYFCFGYKKLPLYSFVVSFFNDQGQIRLPHFSQNGKMLPHHFFPFFRGLIFAAFFLAIFARYAASAVRRHPPIMLTSLGAYADSARYRPLQAPHVPLVAF